MISPPLREYLHCMRDKSFQQNHFSAAVSQIQRSLAAFHGCLLVANLLIEDTALDKTA